jgi:protein O-GlcNAc transferase
LASSASDHDKLLLLRFDTAVAGGSTIALEQTHRLLAAYVSKNPAESARISASLRLRRRNDDAWTALANTSPTALNAAAEACLIGGHYLSSQRISEALVCFQFAIQGSPNLFEGRLGLADCFLQQRKFLDAERQFRFALRIRTSAESAWMGLGQCLLHTGRGAEALDAFSRVSGDMANSALMMAWRGTATSHAGNDDAAIALYRQALVHDPDCFDAVFGLALIEERRGALDEATRYYTHAYKLQPASNLALGNLVYCLRRMAAWSEMAAPEAELIARLERGDIGDYATQWMGIDVSAMTFFDIARRFIRAQSGLKVNAVAREFSPRNSLRLRVGYVSSDFRNHATSRLLVEVLEKHDRTRFEIFAYALKPRDDSNVGNRVAAACEHFVDVSNWPATRVAQRMLDDGIDVMVDLNGHTKGACSGLAALRPAPVIVNYLGYPGTMGDFVDYIIGDHYVTPIGSENEFSETIVRLPHSYQANDSQREIGAAATRTQHGLPENAIVACSFNQAWKLTPTIWAIWIRLLQNHRDLVLWLIDDNRWATQNLRQRAVDAGIAKERIVFSPRMAHPEHLARLALADIALDSAPCTSHTTGSDALWMGVPLVTLVGKTFDARVGESLLRAVGMPELITRSAHDYEEKLNALIGAPDVLKTLKRNLLDGRGDVRLFDSGAKARELERAYELMLERYRAGLVRIELDITVTP